MSRDQLAIVARSVGLPSLFHSTIAFLSAFGLEALMPGNGLWTRLPVGVVLVMIIVLIFWCAWTMLEAKADFSLLSEIHALKDHLVDSALCRRYWRKLSIDPGDREGREIRCP